MLQPSYVTMMSKNIISLKSAIVVFEQRYLNQVFPWENAFLAIFMRFMCFFREEQVDIVTH